MVRIAAESGRALLWAIATTIATVFATKAAEHAYDKLRTRFDGDDDTVEDDDDL